jgi:hypothetical protein
MRHWQHHRCARCVDPTGAAPPPHGHARGVPTPLRFASLSEPRTRAKAPERAGASRATLSYSVRGSLVLALAAAAAASCGCGAPAPGPELQILGESTRLRLEDPVPADSPWFDGARVTLVAARGETIGIQIVQRAPAPVSLAIAGPGLAIRGYAVEAFPVSRPSTAIYGGSHGAGTYADALTEAAAPATNPAYFEIAVAADAAPGPRAGRLVVGARAFPVALEIARPVLPAPPPRVWAYEDPRELGWAADPDAPERDRARPWADERACHQVFRAHGVLLTPDLRYGWWQHRRDLVADSPYVPVVIPKEPAAAPRAVRWWIEAVRGTGQVPFTIPIDEPATPAARAKVRALAAAVRAAGGGPGRFLYAVTAEPHPELGDAIDLYIGLRTAHLTGDAVPRWTYNGAPPRAGALVLDAETPGPRTWGWIGWRWNIPVWYVWDALYWHDRHNRPFAPVFRMALDPRVDPVSFDDGDDHGNLDGVLALPAPGGCRPTLRLAAIRRGQEDRALLELAARCAPEETARLAAALVPAALGDAPRSGPPAWPTDEAAWERARRRLIELASCAP